MHGFFYYMEKYLYPLTEYLKARELTRQGINEGAAQAIEHAFSSDEPNAFIRNNLDTALDESKPAGTVLLDGIYAEMKWIQRKTATPRKSRE